MSQSGLPLRTIILVVFTVVVTLLAVYGYERFIRPTSDLSTANQASRPPSTLLPPRETPPRSTLLPPRDVQQQSTLLPPRQPQPAATLMSRP